MPTADSDRIRPISSSSARTTLAAILRMDRSSVVWRISRASMPAEIHSATSITSTAEKPPSTKLRSVSRTLPNFQPTSSSSSSNTGSRPVIHSTVAPQAIQEPRRSASLMAPESGQAAASTRTTSRIKASDTNTGTASLNSAGARPVRQQQPRAKHQGQRQ